MVLTSSLWVNSVALSGHLNGNYHVRVPKPGCALKVIHLINLSCNFDVQLGLESISLNMKSCFFFIGSLHHNDFYITNV